MSITALARSILREQEADARMQSEEEDMDSSLPEAIAEAIGFDDDAIEESENYDNEAENEEGKPMLESTFLDDLTTDSSETDSYMVFNQDYLSGLGDDEVESFDPDDYDGENTDGDDSDVEIGTEVQILGNTPTLAEQLLFEEVEEEDESDDEEDDSEEDQDEDEEGDDSEEEDEDDAEEVDLVEMLLSEL